jgi:hypothetical protein
MTELLLCTLMPVRNRFLFPQQAASSPTIIFLLKYLRFRIKQNNNKNLRGNPSSERAQTLDKITKKFEECKKTNRTIPASTQTKTIKEMVARTYFFITASVPAGPVISFFAYYLL